MRVPWRARLAGRRRATAGRRRGRRRYATRRPGWSSWPLYADPRRTAFALWPTFAPPDAPTSTGRTPSATRAANATPGAPAWTAPPAFAAFATRTLQRNLADLPDGERTDEPQRDGVLLLRRHRSHDAIHQRPARHLLPGLAKIMRLKSLDALRDAAVDIALDDRTGRQRQQKRPHHNERYVGNEIPSAAREPWPAETQAPHVTPAVRSSRSSANTQPRKHSERG